MKTTTVIPLLLLITMKFNLVTGQSLGTDTVRIVSLEEQAHQCVRISGFISLTNNAFAPIPAFSFDKPAVIAFVAIEPNKRIQYNPDFSIGLNGQPWMWNNWIRYGFLIKPSVRLYAGVNPTLFFNAVKNGEHSVTEAHRNVTSEVSGVWQSKHETKVGLMYRYNHAFDVGTINGHFIEASATIPGIITFNKVYINVRPQVFYFNNDGNNDGLFVGNVIQTGYRKFPLLIAYQSVQPLWTNFLFHMKYNHNVSLIYFFEHGNK